MKSRKTNQNKRDYYVYKHEEKERTLTQIKQMDTEERITEIARMLSGAALTDASVANARELLGVKK